MGQEQSGPQDTTEAVAGMVLDIGGRQVRMLKKIAEGGYSFVYLVSDVASPTTKYALKRMIASDSAQQRLIDKEIAIMNSLCTKNHPNFVGFLGHTTLTVNGARETYVLMEYCARGSLVQLLQAHMDAKRPLAEERILRVFAQVSSGLKTMHSLVSPSIAHRDLKIENVLIGDDGQYKLCDFGSCSSFTGLIEDRQKLMLEQCHIDRHSTQTYRAPELCDLHRSRREGWSLSSKVDIWALGCILYVMAYYVHPFEDGGVLGILSGKVSFPQTTPSPSSPNHSTLIHGHVQQLPTYSPYLNYAISQCLTFDPAKRPSADALLILARSWALYLKTKTHAEPTLGRVVDTWVPRVVHSDDNYTSTPNSNSNTNSAVRAKQPICAKTTQPLKSTQASRVSARTAATPAMPGVASHAEFEVDWSDGDDGEYHGDSTPASVSTFRAPSRTASAISAKNVTSNDDDFDALFANNERSSSTTLHTQKVPSSGPGKMPSLATTQSSSSTSTSSSSIAPVQRGPVVVPVVASLPPANSRAGRAMLLKAQSQGQSQTSSQVATPTQFRSVSRAPTTLTSMDFGSSQSKDDSFEDFVADFETITVQPTTQVRSVASQPILQRNNVSSTSAFSDDLFSVFSSAPPTSTSLAHSASHGNNSTMPPFDVTSLEPYQTTSGFSTVASSTTSSQVPTPKSKSRTGVFDDMHFVM